MPVAHTLAEVLPIEPWTDGQTPVPDPHASTMTADEVLHTGYTIVGRIPKGVLEPYNFVISVQTNPEDWEQRRFFAARG